MLRRNRGQVLVIFALVLFMLMGFAALGVDAAYMYAVRHELQRCADSGALAGASAFFDGSWADPTIQAVADARARDFAHRDIVSTTVLDPAGDVTVTFPAQDRVQVTTQRTVSLFFARVLGRPIQAITATAVAEARLVDQKVPCIKPWGIPFPWNDADADGLWDPDEAVRTDCPDGAGAGYFCQGSQIVLKVGTPVNSPNNPDNVVSLQQESGHFFALDFGSGAHTYEEMIKGRCPDNTTVSVGDQIPIKTGNMVGPTEQGVEKDKDSLFAQDPTSHWNYDKNLPESDLYKVADGTWMNSPRVVRIPIYDPSEPLRTGNAKMTVASLAGFWVEDVVKQGQQATVYGRFIPLSAFGESSGNNQGPNAGPVLRILRLVE